VLFGLNFDVAKKKYVVIVYSYNYLLEGYNTLRDNYNHDIKKMAGETDHLRSR